MKYFLFSFCSLLTVHCVNAQTTLRIEAGTTFKTSNGVIVHLQDCSLVNNGSFDQTTGDGTIEFSGTQNNAIAGNNACTFDILQMVKTGSASVLLNQSLNINSSINFTSGLIDLNGQNIFLQPSAALTNESETSRITGLSGGYIQITSALNAPSSANPGNLGAFISSSQNLGPTIIRRGHQMQMNSYGNGSSILRYYEIIPTNNSNLNASFQAQYFDAELNGLTENTLVFWENASGRWINHGFDLRNTASNFVVKNNIASFSKWTLSSPFNALPVKFIFFNAHCENNSVQLQWQTAFELSASKFVVERSVDGVQWNAIGIVAAAGNTATEQHYSFMDNTPKTTCLYRIAEYDNNGNVTYSSVASSNCNNGHEWKIWPNPVADQIFISIHAQSSSTVSIRLIDSKGALVKQRQSKVSAGNNLLSIDVTNLPAGMYDLIIINQNERNSVKLVKK